MRANRWPVFGAALAVAALSVAGGTGLARGATVVVATGDNLTLLDPVSGAYRGVVPVGAASRGVVVTSDGSTAFSVGGNILVQSDIGRREVLALLTLPTKPRAVALSDDDSVVLVGRPGRVDLFATATLARVGRIDIGARDVVELRVRGSRGVALDSGGRMRVLDLARRRVLTRPNLRDVGGLDFTPSGDHIRVSVGGSRPGLRLLRSSTGQLVSTRRVPTGGMAGGIAHSCDGRRVYVAPRAGQRGLVTVDVRARKLLGRVLTESGRFAPVVGPSGRVFLAGGQPFTNYVPAYRASPLVKLKALIIGEGEKPYGIAVTPDPC